MPDLFADRDGRDADRSFATLRRELLAGTPDAWSRLVGRYSKFVWSVALKLLAGVEDREDVAATIYTNVFERLARDDHRLIRRFEGRSRFTTYLFRMVQSERRDHFERVRRRENLSVELKELPAPTSEPPTVLRPEMLREAVRRAAARLGDGERLVLSLRFRDGLKLREIAERLGMRDTGEAARAVYRAIDRLDTIGELARECRLGDAERAALEEFLRRELFSDAERRDARSGTT